MKALNSRTKRIAGVTFGILRQYLARAGASIVGGRNSGGSASAMCHLSSERLTLVLVITCIIAVAVAMLPTQGFAQTPPNNAATGAPSITGAARVG